VISRCVYWRSDQGEPGAERRTDPAGPAAIAGEGCQGSGRDSGGQEAAGCTGRWDGRWCPAAQRSLWRVVGRPTTEATAVAATENMWTRCWSGETFIVCLSVCNVGAPYSAGWNFRQFFFAIWYIGHPLTSTENFTAIVPGEPLTSSSGSLNGRGAAKYSDFWHLECCISETAQDRR